MTSPAERLARARAMWRYVGEQRPPFAQAPAAGQESVWDYPRPPCIQADRREVVVRSGETDICRTRQALRVLETASPPTFYLPQDDVRMDLLFPAGGESFCEWKGTARYWSVQVGGRRIDAAVWSYADPLPGFEPIRGHLAFYPSAFACSVDGVPVMPQPGRFYGGWVTPDVVGPFKGEPGSGGW